MKLRIAVLSAVVVTFVSVSHRESSAADQSAQVNAPTVPAAERTGIIPSRAEIRAVPEPGQGRLAAYGLNLHPGARLARRVLGR